MANGGTDGLAERQRASYALHLSRLDLDAQGRIGRDLPCRACGYNLRGSRTDADCPECGAAVSLSVRGDELRYADARWVARVARGMWHIWLSVVLAILAFLVAFALILLSAALWSGGVMMAMAATAVAGGFVLASTILYVLGIWGLTAAEPGGDEQPETPTGARTLARWMMVLGFAMFPAAMGATAMGPVVSGLVAMLASLVFGMSWIAMFRYLSYLATRLRSRGLARSSRRVTYGLALLTAVNVAEEALGMAVGAAPMAASPPWAIGLTCGVLLLTLVIGLWALRLIDRFKVELARAAKEATQNEPLLDPASLPTPPSTAATMETA